MTLAEAKALAEAKRTEAAITEEVWRERPYQLYMPGDWLTVTDVDSKYEDELRPGQRRWIRTRVIDVAPGLVMKRHALPGSPPAWAQLRPFRDERFGTEDGVVTEHWPHAHEPNREHLHYPHEHFGRGGRNTGRTSDGLDVEQHLARALHEEATVDDTHAHPQDWSEHLANEEYTHAPNVGEATHTHIERARYCYPPAAKVRWHSDRCRARSTSAACSPKSGCRWIDDPVAPSRAKGIDVHPLAWAHILRGGHRFYFALEALLKADSILSEGAGTAVANIGSVTLWDSEELYRFASTYIAGKFAEVVIVADSDLHGKELVAYNAHQVAAIMRAAAPDVNVIAAAPPPKRRECGDRAFCTHGRIDRLGRYWPHGDHKNGVDDFRGLEGGRLSELLTDRPGAPMLTADRWHRQASGRTDRRDTAREVLRYLQSLAHNGVAFVTERGIAAAVFGDERQHARAGRGLDYLAEDGAIQRTVIDRDPQLPPWRHQQTGTRVVLAPELRPAGNYVEIGDVVEVPEV